MATNKPKQTSGNSDSIFFKANRPLRTLFAGKKAPYVEPVTEDKSAVEVKAVPVKPAKPQRKQIKVQQQPIDAIFKNLNALSVDAVTEEKFAKHFATLQSIVNDASRIRHKLEQKPTAQIYVDEILRDQAQAVKNKFHHEKRALESLLDEVQPNNETEKQMHRIIKTKLRLLDNQIVISTGFDDPRVDLAVKSVKKESGANLGYTIANSDKDNTRFTVKQGSSVGNTLSEAFSSMVLTQTVNVMNDEKKPQALIATAFLTIKAPDENDSALSIEERSNKRLYAASQWSNDKASFEACQLFGLEKRKRGAGSRQVQDFEDLRRLNRECGLGLEKIFIPTALIADFDLHSENFMLKVDISHVTDPQDKIHINEILKNLNESMKKTENVSREVRMKRLINNIHILKYLGANVYFHKIDHDSGFYRYADPKRKVDFLTHRTSPIHREGMILKTQPTLHITEITGATKAGMDELLLSDDAIDKLISTDLNIQLSVVINSAINFFEAIHAKSEVLAGVDEPHATEFYLLNEFYHHISEKRMTIPKSVTDKDIYKLKGEILDQLELGTKLKVTDLHTQVYKRIMELEKNRTPLTEKQMKLKNFLEQQDYIKPLTVVKKSILSRLPFMKK